MYDEPIIIAPMRKTWPDVARVVVWKCVCTSETETVGIAGVKPECLVRRQCGQEVKPMSAAVR